MSFLIAYLISCCIIWYIDIFKPEKAGLSLLFMWAAFFNLMMLVLLVITS